MVQPTKNYFLVKLSKQEQLEKQENVGRFKVVRSATDMNGNLQFGEIVAIGANAAKEFPEAKEGHILIMHHFVEGDKDTRNDALVFEDETFRYYVVSVISHGHKANETYGVWDGEKIIPHKDYVFLEEKKPEITQIEQDRFHDAAMKTTKAGLLVFKEYKLSREDLLLRIKNLRDEVMELSKTKMNPELKVAIEEKEREMQSISKKMNSGQFLPFTVAYSSPALNEWFDKEIKRGDTLFVQEHASTPVDFQNITYYICKSNYIGWALN